ncbi:DUF2127 domain-containing protein [Skermania sp. ID1734]|uniref:DUF2127 domain-containing protein n=1 Tax=Skermania sp. ID1734 TaxID=2597516 RepID=UPI00117C9FEF|nr:DUF2127 domain-containing protein [Skermania sp. ID1734]TSE01399.1 DUF2127 domain-containing protein [Skermania sp. ID1734]
MDFALRSCSWRGHATFAPDEPEYRQHLLVNTTSGEAWRCLRCENFIIGPPKGHGPASDAPQILRGRLLRDRFIMRLLACERMLRVIIFALLAWGVVRVRGSQTHLQEAFERELPVLRPVANQIGWNPDNSKIIRDVQHAFTLSPTTLAWIAAALAGYALIELVEAVGLWLGHRWGEYFAVVATSVFLPLEVYELTERVTAFKLIAFLINIAAVLWLLWSKRLFGLNGGGAAYRRERSQDSLLSVKDAAASPA